MKMSKTYTVYTNIFISWIAKYLWYLIRKQINFVFFFNRTWWTLALIVLFFINCDRSVEILYAAAVAKANKMSEQLYSLLKLLPDLNVGRQELALFQHHDAITGTSRKTVTENYRKRYCMLIRKIHFGKNLALIMIKWNKWTCMHSFLTPVLI